MVATQTRNKDNRVPTRKCKMKDCTEHTRERKPYCSTHVMEIDRPKALFAILAEVEAEIERVAVKGPSAVNILGLVVEEIMAGLAHVGSITWRRLCKNHVAFFNRVSDVTVDHYLTRLRDEGLIAALPNRRGVTVVSLTPRGLRLTQKELR